jgi:hypothetical protein
MSSTAPTAVQSIALLVKLGQCSFLQKALVALEISRNFSTKWIVDVVLVYNDNATELDALFTPTSSNLTNAENTELQDLGLVFVSTSSGSEILEQIEFVEQAQNTSAILQAPGFDLWKLQVEIQSSVPSLAVPTNPPFSNKTSSSRSLPSASCFQFLVIVFVSVILLS